MKKNASSTIYLTVFLIMFLIFLAFAIDGAIVLTNRSKLQNAAEICALSGAAEFTYDLEASSSEIENQIKNTVQDTFELLKYGGLEHVELNNSDIVVNTNQRTVTVNLNMIAAPYFLSFFGVNGVNVEAEAIAISETLNVTANYAEINWINSVAASYYSDIISKLNNFNDTAILLPLDEFNSASYHPIQGLKYDLINSGGGNEPLSLGPGGFITIKLPTPIIDKPGYDLYIKESGKALEGYMVFAGLDNDPNDPYINIDNTGSGVSWINISCSGEPENEDVSNKVGAYSISTTNLGTQDNFYGSGYFDIGDSCITGTENDISMAKYIRIVDDNSETGFITTGASFYYKTMLYGEASTVTPGADIDSVQVLNHVKLISN